MRRYGPLLAAPDALVVGDPGREHLRLTSGGVAHRNGREHRESFAWEQLSMLHLDVPTTRFRYPGLVGTIGLGILSAAVQDDLGIDPDEGSVDIVIEGEPRRLALDRHHVGGYWEPTVTGAQRLLDQLLARADQRALLKQPGALVGLAAKLARQAD